MQSLGVCSLLPLVVLSSACSGSTTPDAATDAGIDAPDAARDAGADARSDGGADAEADASVDARPDAGECPINCVRDVVTWRWDGGLAATENRYELSECARVVRTTTDLFTGESTYCLEHVDLTQCTLVDPIVDLLRDPDVVTAREAAPILYGADERPSDGAVFAITLDGALIELGGECRGASGCTEVPTGLAALQDALRLMQTQVDDSASCAEPREDPTFDCRIRGGATLQCVVGDEYCFSPFRCTPTPESCGGPATCECVSDGFGCTEEAGAVTVMWTE